ncbi:MAG: Colicin V production protein [Parcubacteria group bacterium ADurb.Bin326]|nr:MAG: Colicin V production protein [Parcubacteria group bacterium ADurb.Bin326]
MTFTLVDVILILIVFSFVAIGFGLGLIRSIGALIGLVIGTWVAGRYFMPVADWLTPILMGRESLAKILAFILVFFIINRLVVLIFHFLSKGFDVLSFLPFAKTFNRLGGLILGLIEGVLTAGLLVYAISKLAPDISFVQNNIASSSVAHFLVSWSWRLIALLPEALRKIISIF